MRSILVAVVALVILIAVQVVVWRLRTKGGHYLALSGLALAVLVGSLVTVAALGSVDPPPVPFVPQTILEVWNFVMLYAAMALCYMITYSAVQADSPTMAILLLIEGAGGRGRSRDELLAELDDAVLVVPRLNDLIIGDLVELQGGRYHISRRGSLLARIYMGYRSLLAMEKGG